MKQRTAIRIRQERARSWRRFPGDLNPKCPTCGRGSGWTSPQHMRVRRGHRFLVSVGRSYNSRHRLMDTPLSKPIRLSWPVKVEGWRTYITCPDEFHKHPKPEQPEPRQSNAIARLMRVSAPDRRKAKARRHRDAQSYQRR